jgi:uncharacterized damage-inducible protein DinB
MNQDKHNERIEEYGRGFDVLMATLAEIPREAWAFKPAPDQWSVHEILVHMKDGELNGVLRLHKLIAEPGVLDYQTQDVDDALEMFRLLQRTTYRLLKTLPDEAWARSIVHPEEQEPYTMEMWLAIYTEHVPEHCEQLRGVYKAWKAAGHYIEMTSSRPE